MTIDKIGPGGPKPGAAGGALPAERPGEASPAGKAAFTEALKPAGSAEAADQLAAAIQAASSKISAGELTKEQAVDFILSTYRKELLKGAMSPEEADGAIEFLREIITDDPAIDALLSGK